MPKKTNPRIGITLGDINGIGPEVTLKALWDARVRKFADFVLIGAAQALILHVKALGLKDVGLHITTTLDDVKADAINVLDLADGRKPLVQFGKETEIAGQLSMQAVERAVELCKTQELDAMVTAPISKKAISLAGYQFPGHTEFIAARTQCAAFTMMMVTEQFRVGLVSTHVPIREVADLVTAETIGEKLRIIHASMQTDFGIQRPKIAVLGLNPHAGEGGVIGQEERDVIRPAVEDARANDLLAFGPFPADGFFGMRRYQHYDAVLAMYHDQGLVPFKALSFNQGVNFTAGLPIVRTSPDHGTAYDIAGKGTAEPGSMRHAIYLALDVVRRRKQAAGLPA